MQVASLERAHCLGASASPDGVREHGVHDVSNSGFDNPFSHIQAIAVFCAGYFRLGLKEGISVNRVQFSNQVGSHLKATIGERRVSCHYLQGAQGNGPAAKSKLNISREVCRVESKSRNIIDCILRSIVQDHSDGD